METTDNTERIWLAEGELPRNVLDMHPAPTPTKYVEYIRADVHRKFDDGYLSGLRASASILTEDNQWEAAGVMRAIARNYEKTKTTSGVAGQ